MNSFYFKKIHGFTMVELIVTMIIVAALTTASILTMRGYVPKQRLTSSVGSLEQALSQAQYEATSRVYWTCLANNTANNTLEVIVDRDSDRTCGSGGDFTVASYSISQDITFSDCPSSPGDGNPFNDLDGFVWFNTSGGPQLCDSGLCASEALEFIVVNDQLPSGNRAREVEVSTSGLIEIVNRRELGYNLTTYAKTATGTTSDGCE